MNSQFWRSKVLVFTIIGLFTLMVFAENIPSKEGLYSHLIAQGNEFYENGELEKAIAKYQSAQVVAANNEEMAAAYFLLALTHYVLGDLENCQSNLENYFSVSAPNADPLINKKLPLKFVEYFKTQKKEYQRNSEPVVYSPAQVKKQTNAIEKKGTVRIKKKRKVWPWILLGIVGIGVLAFLLSKKKTSDTQQLTQATTLDEYRNELSTKYGLDTTNWLVFANHTANFGQGQEKASQYYAQNEKYYEEFDIFSGYFEHYAMDPRFQSYPIGNGNIEMILLDRNNKRYQTKSYDYNTHATAEGESRAFVAIGNQYTNYWDIEGINIWDNDGFLVPYACLQMAWIEESIVKYNGKAIYRMLKVFDGAAINPDTLSNNGREWYYEGNKVATGDGLPSSRWAGLLRIRVLEVFDAPLTPPFDPTTKLLLNGGEYNDLWIRTRN